MIDVVYIFFCFVVTAFFSAALLFPGLFHHMYILLLLEMVLALEVENNTLDLS